jgi:hypothetical protein
LAKENFIKIEEKFVYENYLEKYKDKNLDNKPEFHRIIESLKILSVSTDVQKVP